MAGCLLLAALPLRAAPAADQDGDVNTWNLEADYLLKAGGCILLRSDRRGDSWEKTHVLGSSRTFQIPEAGASGPDVFHSALGAVAK